MEIYVEPTFQIVGVSERLTCVSVRRSHMCLYWITFISQIIIGVYVNVCVAVSWMDMSSFYNFVFHH